MYNTPMTFNPQKILVPIDLSELSRKALACAADLGARYGSRIVILTVIEDRFPYPDLFSFESPTEDYYKVMRERAHVELQKLAQQFPHMKDSIDLYITRGYPATKIVEVANQEKTDLIVMGTHGTSGIAHAILGSVTDKVIRKAPCPVLLVRHTVHE